MGSSIRAGLGHCGTHAVLRQVVPLIYDGRLEGINIGVMGVVDPSAQDPRGWKAAICLWWVWLRLGNLNHSLVLQINSKEVIKIAVAPS